VPDTLIVWLVLSTPVSNSTSSETSKLPVLS
jgi:hypothetical protein